MRVHDFLISRFKFENRNAPCETGRQNLANVTVVSARAPKKCAGMNESEHLSYGCMTRDERGQVARLFADYRVFYGYPLDLSAAQQFIDLRCKRQDSVIVVARRSAASSGGAGGVAGVAGFVQLYALPNSLDGGQMMILNDLYVDPPQRGAGVARALMRAAQAQAQTMGVQRLELSTHHTNLVAQRLYHSLGWQLDADFKHYFLLLEPAS